MKKIERPDWKNIWSSRVNTLAELDAWFDEKVEPINKLLEESVTVFCSDKSTSDECEPVYWKYWDDNGDKYKAYLIGIEPINKETAEEVLRDLINIKKHPVSGPHPFDISELQDRAKKVLNE